MPGVVVGDNKNKTSDKDQELTASYGKMVFDDDSVAITSVDGRKTTPADQSTDSSVTDYSFDVGTDHYFLEDKERNKNAAGTSKLTPSNTSATSLKSMIQQSSDTTATTMSPTSRTTQTTTTGGSGKVPELRNLLDEPLSPKQSLQPQPSFGSSYRSLVGQKFTPSRSSSFRSNSDSIHTTKSTFGASWDDAAIEYMLETDGGAGDETTSGFDSLAYSAGTGSLQSSSFHASAPSLYYDPYQDDPHAKHDQSLPSTIQTTKTTKNVVKGRNSAASNKSKPPTTARNKTTTAKKKESANSALSQMNGSQTQLFHTSMTSHDDIAMMLPDATWQAPAETRAKKRTKQRKPSGESANKPEPECVAHEIATEGENNGVDSIEAPSMKTATNNKPIRRSTMGTMQKAPSKNSLNGSISSLPVVSNTSSKTTAAPVTPSSGKKKVLHRLSKLVGVVGNDDKHADKNNDLASACTPATVPATSSTSNSKSQTPQTPKSAPGKVGGKPKLVVSAAAGETLPTVGVGSSTTITPAGTGVVKKKRIKVRAASEAGKDIDPQKLQEAVKRWNKEHHAPAPETTPPKSPKSPRARSVSRGRRPSSSSARGEGPASPTKEPRAKSLTRRGSERSVDIKDKDGNLLLLEVPHVGEDGHVRKTVSLVKKKKKKAQEDEETETDGSKTPKERERRSSSRSRSRGRSADCRKAKAGDMAVEARADGKPSKRSASKSPGRSVENHDETKVEDGTEKARRTRRASRNSRRAPSMERQGSKATVKSKQVSVGTSSTEKEAERRGRSRSRGRKVVPKTASGRQASFTTRASTKTSETTGNKSRRSKSKDARARREGVSPIRIRGISMVPSRPKHRSPSPAKRSTSQPPASTRHRFGEFLFSSFKAIKNITNHDRDDPSTPKTPKKKMTKPRLELASLTPNKMSIFDSEVIGELGIDSSNNNSKSTVVQKSSGTDGAVKKSMAPSSGHTWDNNSRNDISFFEETDNVPMNIHIVPASPSKVGSGKNTIGGNVASDVGKKGEGRHEQPPSPATASNVSAISEDMMFRRIKAAGITGTLSHFVGLCTLLAFKW